MANIEIKDGACLQRYLSASGTGTIIDPFIPNENVTVTNGTNPIVTSGNADTILATLTVTNGAYTIGDAMGGLVTFAGAARAIGGHVVVNSVKLLGVVTTAIPVEVWFFNADLATPVADNGVLTLVAADCPKFLGSVPIAAADYSASTGGTVFQNATVRGVGLELEAGAATTTIYAYVKTLAVTSPGTTTIYLAIDVERLD